MRYFINATGQFAGAWDTFPPDKLIEVPFPPEDSRQTWIGEGWSEIPAVVPMEVTRRQGRLALLETDKLLAVEEFIAAISDVAARLKAQVEYEADTWHRDNVWLNEVATFLGLTSEDLDSLFILAAGKAT